MKKIIYITILAFIAGGLREFLVLLTGSYQNLTITLINILGSFLLASLIPLLPILKVSDAFISGVSIGFIGSFTTFSTFAMQTVVLLQVNLWLAVLFLVANLAGGIIFAILGRKVADYILAHHDPEVDA